MPVVLFGATGYTGRLTAAAMVRRGMHPILAARRREPLAALAAELGGLETRVADVAAPESVRALVERGDVLVTTVGPFVRFGQPALAAALDKGAHYLDSTGEPAFVRAVFEQSHDSARNAGITLLTAFGYDYVPGHAAAALALQRAGDKAVAVYIGYFFTGRGKPSEGTRASMLTAMNEPGLLFSGGTLREAYAGRTVRRFPVGESRRAAVSIAGTEHLFLPRMYPRLRDVGVYLGPLGAFSYAAPIVSRLHGALLALAPYARLVQGVARRQASSGAGPSETGARGLGVVHRGCRLRRFRTGAGSSHPPRYQWLRFHRAHPRVGRRTRRGWRR